MNRRARPEKREAGAGSEGEGQGEAIGPMIVGMGELVEMQELGEEAGAVVPGEHGVPCVRGSVGDLVEHMARVAGGGGDEVGVGEARGELGGEGEAMEEEARVELAEEGKRGGAAREERV